MALADRVANERIFGLQIEDIKLVDARRDQQERLFINLGGQGLVFDELEKLVLENHSAFGGRHVLANLEQALVGH